MTAVTVAVTAACRGCGACLLTCEERAFRPAGPARPAEPNAGPLIVLEDRCTGCGDCVEICPADAISMIVSHSDRVTQAVAEETAGDGVRPPVRSQAVPWQLERHDRGQAMNVAGG
jgi:electron transport complex protein RnfB